MPAGGVLARTGLLGAGALGVLLLVLATFLTVIQIRVGTVERLAALETAFSGWDRHGPALLMLGGLAAAMLLGAARGARPAMAAVAVLGVVVLALVLLQDVPDADEVGKVGDLYADASAETGPGFLAEVAGGVLLLGAGGGLLLLAAPPSARRRREQQRPGDVPA